MSRRRSRAPAALGALAAIILLSGCGKTGVSTRGSGGGNAGGQHQVGRTATPSATFIGPAGAGGVSTGSTTRLGGGSPTLDAAAVARALHPGLTAAGRPQAVVIVSLSDWEGALPASALAAAPLNAPILYSEGSRLPPASAEALAAMHPTGARALGGAQAIVIGNAPAPAGYRTMRIAAAGRFALAAKIAGIVATLQKGSVPGVIVVSASAPKALSMPAAGLAAESGAPILLVGGGVVPAQTSEQIARLGSPPIYVVGPAAAVGDTTVAALRGLGETTRIAASGVVANAIAIAAFTNGRFGWGVQEPGHGLVFVRSSRPFDAPAAAPLSSGADYGPLLLLTSGEGVPPALSRYLRDIQPGYSSAPESRPVRGVYNRGWLIGDGAAISMQTQAQLNDLLQSVPRTGAGAPPSIVP